MSKEEGITLHLTGDLATQFVKFLASEVAKKTEFTPPNQELTVTPQEGADMLKCHVDTFKAKAEKEGFRKVPVGRSVRYVKEDVINHIRNR